MCGGGGGRSYFYHIHELGQSRAYPWSKPWGRGPDLPFLPRPIAYNTTVDCTTDTVVQLHVDGRWAVVSLCVWGGGGGGYSLMYLYLITTLNNLSPRPTRHQYGTEPLTVVHAGLLQVPHSRSLNNVPNNKLLNGLVLWNASKDTIANAVIYLVAKDNQCQREGEH